MHENNRERWLKGKKKILIFDYNPLSWFYNFNYYILSHFNFLCYNFIFILNRLFKL